MFDSQRVLSNFSRAGSGTDSSLVLEVHDKKTKEQQARLTGAMNPSKKRKPQITCVVIFKPKARGESTKHQVTIC